MIKDELDEFVKYNEIISNFNLSLMIFTCVTFFFCLGYNTLSPDLTYAFIISSVFFVILTLVDVFKR